MSKFKKVLKCALFLSGLLVILFVSGFVFSLYICAKRECAVCFSALHQGFDSSAVFFNHLRYRQWLIQ